MKKNILILLSVLMASATTAWGQVSTSNFSASYSQGGPYTYDGQEHNGVSGISANCTYQVTGTQSATNAGHYSCTVASFCPGHYEYVGSRWQIEWYHVGAYTIDWVINPRDLNDDVEIKVNDQQWTGQEIDVNDVYTIKYNDQDLTEDDYDVVVTKLESPVNILDEGRYTIVFTGKGNFTGQYIETFDVKKDLSKGEDFTGVHFDIPEQIFIKGQSFDFQVEVSDKISHAKLYENEDYTVAFYSKAEATSDFEIEETAVNLGEGEKAKKYWVVFTGVAPKYDPEKSIKKAFYVINEYQESAPSPATHDPNIRGNLDGLAKVNIRITKPGYPVAQDSPNGKVELGEAKVAPKTDGSPAIDVESKRCMILDTIKVAVVDGETTEYVNHNIVGIENNAFAGCKTLRWINSLIPGTYVPTSLDRTVIDTPFYGIPRQTLVYLYGYNITGENYIYKITENDFRSALFHIYEDIKGDQTKYSDQK